MGNSTTLIMYWTQVLHPPDGWWSLARLMGPLVWLGTTVTDSRLAGWLFGMNAAALVAWELAAARGVSWLAGRRGARLIGMLAFLTVLAPTFLITVTGGEYASEHLTLVSPVLFAAALAASLWYYQYRKADLFMLTVGLFGLILVIMALVAHHLPFGPFANFEYLLVLAVLLVLQVAGAAWWLKGVRSR